MLSLVASPDDTGKKTPGKGGVVNETDSERGIDSDAVTRLCGGKNGMDSKNVASADTKYLLLEGL